MLKSIILEDFNILNNNIYWIIFIVISNIVGIITTILAAIFSLKSHVEKMIKDLDTQIREKYDIRYQQIIADYTAMLNGHSIADNAHEKKFKALEVAVEKLLIAHNESSKSHEYILLEIKKLDEDIHEKLLYLENMIKILDSSNIKDSSKSSKLRNTK